MMLAGKARTISVRTLIENDGNVAVGVFHVARTADVGFAGRDDP